MLCGHLIVFSHDVSMSHVDVGVKAVMDEPVTIFGTVPKQHID